MAQTLADAHFAVAQAARRRAVGSSMPARVTTKQRRRNHPTRNQQVRPPTTVNPFASISAQTLSRRPIGRITGEEPRCDRVDVVAGGLVLAEDRSDGEASHALFVVAGRFAGVLPNDRHDDLDA